jgi:nitrogen fixation/metabolism regulation signal transduction histidine kinase
VSSLITKFDNSKIDKNYLDKWIEKIDKQINFMSQTIDDFKNFYKPKEEFKKIFLKETILKIASLVNFEFKVNNIQIKIDICESISLLALENQLQQAIINILLNAKDAIINKNINNGIVYINAKKKNSSIELIIQDNGGGVENKEILKSMFEPYFTTKLQSQGTGIGLYMTKIIIEQNMKGKIEVKNIPNGLKFTIKIPI